MMHSHQFVVLDVELVSMRGKQLLFALSPSMSVVILRTSRLDILLARS